MKFSKDADGLGVGLTAYQLIRDFGGLRLIVKRLSDGGVVFNVDEPDLDFWRGEENVRFANFSIEEVLLAN